MFLLNLHCSKHQLESVLHNRQHLLAPSAVSLSGKLPGLLIMVGFLSVIAFIEIHFNTLNCKRQYSSCFFLFFSNLSF